MVCQSLEFIKRKSLSWLLIDNEMEVKHLSTKRHFLKEISHSRESVIKLHRWHLIYEPLIVFPFSFVNDFGMLTIYSCFVMDNL